MVGFDNNVTISGNNVSGMNYTTSIDEFGINLGFGVNNFSTTTTGSNEVINAIVTKNVVGTVTNSGTYSAVGIALAAATSGTSLIANNMISGIASNGTSGDFGAGIVLGGGTGSTTNIYYNSISMQGTIPGSSPASQLSACLAVTNSTAPTLDLRNNIFSNTQLGNTSATVKFVSIGLAYSSTTGNYSGLTSNTNDLYSAGPGPGTYHIGITGGLVSGTTRTTLANWQTETGRDAASKNVLPVFVSATDLHLNPTNSSNIANLNAMGTAVSVTDDIDCQTRGFSTSLIGLPDIGADEFNAATGKHYVNDNSTSGDVFTTAVGNNSNPGTPTDPFLTITYAISQSNSNDTIYVDAGTYIEQVLINKNLTIIGADSAGPSAAVIKAPAVIPFVINANGSDHTPIIYASGIGDTINIHHVGIDGDGRGGSNFHGVYYFEASGSFTNSRIAKVRDAVFSGVQSGNAFFANHTYDVSVDHRVIVSDNVIEDYQKTGILINELNTHGIITNNIISGQNIKHLNGQNGIQLGYGAYGTITGNIVTNNVYNGPAADVATGILLAGVGVNNFNVATGKTTTIGGAGALANFISGNEAGLFADGGGFGYDSNAGVIYNGDNYSNNIIHVSLNSPNLVPTTSNTYDKRVDNTSQTNIVYGQIQRAVDDASAGNTLNASADTFTEQVEIHKAITLAGQGSGLTTILSPDTLALSYTTSAVNKPVVYVHDTSDVIIKNLTVDGAGKGIVNARFQGIAFRNAGGTVRECEIKGIRNTPIDGVQAGVALFSLDDNGTARTLNVIKNNIHDFQKNATVFAGADLTSVIDSNIITGAGSINFTAQNGVQLSSGAKGRVTNNTVSGFNYTPATFAATGILIIGTSDTVTTSGNIVNNSQFGINYFQASGTIRNNIIKYNAANMGSTPYWYGIIVGDGITTVTQNTVNGGGDGAGIEADAFASLDNIRIKSNPVSGETAGFKTDNVSKTGVLMRSDAMGEITTMNAENNFVDSADEGFVIYVEGTGDVNSTINENSITNSVSFAIHNYGTDSVNATCNWYGTTNQTIIASKISGPVIYIPFLTNGTDNQPATPGFQPVPGSCEGGLPGVALNITFGIEGFWNGTTQVQDTLRIYLRNTTTPFAPVDSAIVYLNSIGNAIAFFPNATTGNYYIQTIHRNALESWSANPVSFMFADTTSYDFTIAQSQTFGNNAKFKLGRWTAFSGDVNGDGIIDAGDLSLVDNDVLLSTMGYVRTDVSGDDFVDASDLSIVDNNIGEILMRP